MRIKPESFSLRKVMALLSCLPLLSLPFCNAADAKQQASTFTMIYEPSTAIQLVDGRVLIAEDERDQPLFLSSLISANSGPDLEPVQLQEIDIALSDIEGSALGKDGAIYLITSHSTKKKGKRKKKREVLTRLTFKDGKISDTKAYHDLLAPMSKALEGESKIAAANLQQINIEGLCFDSSKNRLLIGLRSPLAGDKVVILVLENPYALFTDGEEPRFHQKKIYLDIGGGGIRSLTSDPERRAYLLVNEIPNKKGKLRPALWSWDGKPDSTPDKVKLPKLGGIRNIEGITLVKFNKKTYLLMVADDGDRKKKKGGHYWFLDTSILAGR